MKTRPMSFLKNTKELVKLCSQGETVHIAEKGQKIFTILSTKKYEQILAELDFHKKMIKASEDVIAGRVYNFEDVVAELNKKYGF